MDVDTLVQTLSATLSPDRAQRDHAEEILGTVGVLG